MYRLGQSRRTHRKLFVFLTLLLIVIVVIVIMIIQYLRPDPHVTASAPITRHISYDTTSYQTFNTTLFSINLPADWKAVPANSDVPAPTYTWHGTVGDSANRWMSVYIDENVSELAVNHALQVQTNGSNLNVLGDVSANCITYTGGAAQTQGHSTPAKWQDISFLCDSGNYERDVVGVVSPDGLNNIAPTGTQPGHHLFLTYSDNAVTADYSIFTKALKSIKFK